MAVGVVPANLATVYLEGFLYGIFIVLAGASGYLLVRRELRLRSRITLHGMLHNPMEITSVMIIMTITAHWIILVVHSFVSFVYFEGGSDPTLEFVSYSFWSWTARITLLAVTVSIFDGVTNIICAGTSLLALLAIIIESAAIHVTWTIAFLAVSLIHVYALRDPFVDLWSPVAGIAFMLINIRVGAGWGKHNRFKNSSSPSEISFASGPATQGETFELVTVDVLESRFTVASRRGLQRN